MKIPRLVGLLFLSAAFLCAMLIMENLHYCDSLQFGVSQFFNPVMRPLFTSLALTYIAELTGRAKRVRWRPPQRADEVVWMLPTRLTVSTASTPGIGNNGKHRGEET